jgi:hypothetical protein
VKATRKRLCSFVFALLLVCALHGHVFGDDSEFTRRSLVGLLGVAVVIEPIEPEFEQAGLAASTLATDVELRLRQLGIHVLFGAERGNTPGQPYLYVNVNLLRDPVGLVAYSVRVELSQRTRLVRDTKIDIWAPTWSTASIGTVGFSKLSEVRGAVRDLVDRFANAYLAENPKLSLGLPQAEARVRRRLDGHV